MAQLLINAGDGTTFSRELGPEKISVGSDAENTIALSGAVPGSYAEIIFANGAYQIHDLGAQSGSITLNGSPVTRAWLDEGDVLRFGADECVFSAAATAPAAPAPPKIPTAPAPPINLPTKRLAPPPPPPVPPAPPRIPPPPPLPVQASAPSSVPLQTTPVSAPPLPPTPPRAAYPSPPPAAPLSPPPPAAPTYPAPYSPAPPPLRSAPPPAVPAYPAAAQVGMQPSAFHQIVPAHPAPPAPVDAALPPMPLPNLPGIAPLSEDSMAAAARVPATSYFAKFAQLFRVAFREGKRRTQMATLNSRLNAARTVELPKAFYHVGTAAYRQRVTPEASGAYYRDIAEWERQLIAKRQEIVAWAPATAAGHPQAAAANARNQADNAALEGRLRGAFSALGAAVAAGDRADLSPDVLSVLLPVEAALAALQKQFAFLEQDRSSRAELAELSESIRHETAEHLQRAGSSFVEMVSGSPTEEAAVDPGPLLPDHIPLGDRIVLGRDPRCTVPLPGRDISQSHLEIIRQGDAYWLRDLYSTSGTFLNGQRIADPVLLKEGDHVRAGAFTFLIQNGALLPSTEKNNTRITIQNLTKTVISLDTKQPLNLLDNVNLVIEPKEFVALLGPSGSGKSTFMDAINGRRRASSGRVMVNDDDFYQSYQYYRRAIGYVPQQDIVHTSLTVRQALRFSARMRLPADTTPGEIEHIVGEVIKKLGLAERAQTRISNLSGGQLKRVSLGVELISDPSLLFLDEATSGLDAGTEGKMMTLFRKIADDGTTVVCITHNVENVYICNMVVVLVRGRLTYYGPPAELPGYFGVQKISEVYDVLEATPAEQWAQRYEQSEYYQQYVVNRMPALATAPAIPADAAGQNGGNGHQFDVRAGRDPRQTSTNFARQFQVLRQRYSLITLQDQKNLLILLAQAPIIAFLVGMVFFRNGAKDNQLVIFLMIISAVWFGCSNSAKEIVKELPIYKRERAINLEILTYLLSKVTVLSVLCALQCLALVMIIIPMTGVEIGFFGPLFIIYLTSLCSMMMGLVVSSLVDNTDKANAITPLLLIPQVIFAGAIIELKGVALLLARLFIVSFWAFDAMCHLADAFVREPKQPAVVDIFFILVMLVAFGWLAIWGLRRKDAAG